MKRIKEACICQTLHFILKEDVGHDYAVMVVQEEIKKYKESLDKNNRVSLFVRYIDIATGEYESKIINKNK